HGFEVIDAGSDVPPEKIAETTVESGANLVALGIYLTHAAPELAKLIGDTVTIMGNLNYNKLVNATPDEMYAACADAIRTAGPGGGYWLAFGCEIPREMPYKNIQAMVRAAKSVGKYPIQSTS
nr:uroporphyrinogen decarboxylase family protein [Candidatus Freyarchaeota archaeon]